MNEIEIAEMEGDMIHAEDAYFDARHPQLDTPHNRHIFRAGFERGYKCLRREKIRPTSQHELAKRENER